NGTTYGYRIRTCPTQTSSCVTGVPAPGPSVVYQPGSATVTADSGDHDNIPDNCELATLQVNLFNDGNTPLTSVKLQTVSSTHAGGESASPVPQSTQSRGVGARAPALFRFFLGRNGSPAACFDPIPFTVTATSDQSPTNTRSFNLAAEKDSISSGTFVYGFESTFQGWTVTAGGFTRGPGGGAGPAAVFGPSGNRAQHQQGRAPPARTAPAS